MRKSILVSLLSLTVFSFVFALSGRTVLPGMEATGQSNESEGALELMRRAQSGTATSVLAASGQPYTGEEPAPQCTSFTEDEGYWGPCEDAPNIGFQISNGYLQVSDLENASGLCTGEGTVGGTNSPYAGDWTAEASCTTFCFDIRVKEAGTAPNDAIQPHVQIRNGNVKATFWAKDMVAEGEGWKRICVPVATISPNENLPSNGEGEWRMNKSTGYDPAWNSLITNVKQLRLPVDFSKSPTEVVQYDNLCLGSCDDLTEDSGEVEVYEPCCPTFFDGNRLSSMISYTLQGTNPYTFKFSTNGTFNAQMNAYADYAKALNPSTQGVRLLLVLADCQQNTKPGDPLNPPGCTGQELYAIGWTGGNSAPHYGALFNNSVSPNSIFSKPSVINNRYRIYGLASYYPQNLNEALEQCGGWSWVDYNAMVSQGKRGGEPGMVVRTGSKDPNALRTLRLNPENRRGLERSLQSQEANAGRRPVPPRRRN